MYSPPDCLDFGCGQWQPVGLGWALGTMVLGHRRAELTMSPAGHAGGSSTPRALFSMSIMEVSKVGLGQCRDQAKGVCLIPLGTREVEDRKSGHGSGFALEILPSLSRSPQF